MTFLAVVCALQMMADYNVRNYGAKGDGFTLDSPAINAAIEDAVQQGGGRVVVPAGRVFKIDTKICSKKCLFSVLLCY